MEIILKNFDNTDVIYDNLTNKLVSDNIFTFYDILNNTKDIKDEKSVVRKSYTYPDTIAYLLNSPEISSCFSYDVYNSFFKTILKSDNCENIIKNLKETKKDEIMKAFNYIIKVDSITTEETKEKITKILSENGFETKTDGKKRSKRRKSKKRSKRRSSKRKSKKY